MTPSLPERIAVVGSSCSGKSTLARQLADRLDLDRIELDALHWLAGWQERDPDEFRALVAERLAGDRWVIDGNYGGRLPRSRFELADTIIWLNLPFTTVYGRVWSRSVRRIFLREELWNGNRETLGQSLFARDSLIYWVPRRWRALQERYRGMFDDPPAGVTMIELRHPREVAAFLASFDTT